MTAATLKHSTDGSPEAVQHVAAMNLARVDLIVYGGFDAITDDGVRMLRRAAVSLYRDARTPVVTTPIAEAVR